MKVGIQKRVQGLVALPHSDPPQGITSRALQGSKRVTGGVRPRFMKTHGAAPGSSMVLHDEKDD